MRWSQAYRTSQDLIPEGTGLPAEAERGGHPVVGAVLSLIGTALLLGAFTSLVAWVVGAGGDVVLGVMLLVMSLFFLPFGLHLLLSHEHWLFAADEVTYAWRGLFGAGNWTEPLAKYRGVMRDSVRHSGGQHGTSYTEYVLRLEHGEEKKKNVQLYSSRSQEGLRAQQERYARLLGVPLLVEAADGIQARQPEELGMSVSQRVAGGFLEVSFDPSKPPPGRSLRARVEGDRLVVRTRPGAMGKAAIVVPLIFVLVGGGLIIAALAGDPAALARAVLVTAGGVFALLGLAGVAFGRTVVQELHISPAQVRGLWRTPFGTVAERQIAADEIEDVMVGTPEGSQGFTMVQVIGEELAVYFGFGLSVEEQQWVRDCVVAVISKSPSSPR